MTERRAPLVALLECAIYAPIGAAVLLKESVPTMVETGKTKVEQRVLLAKMIGQFAVTMGQKELTRRIAEYTAQPAPAPVADQQSRAPRPAASGRAPVEASEAPQTAAVELALADYDHLAASQIVARLDHLSTEQLSAIEAYERAHRQRRTVLGKLAQLAVR